MSSQATSSPAAATTSLPAASLEELQRIAEERKGKSITFRSVLIGVFATLFVAGVAPLNDTILSDTSLAAEFMPLSVVLILFFLVVGVNAPLHRWAPRKALSSGELAVILLMTLCACSLPNWGLMRFFIPAPVAPFHVGDRDAVFWKAFQGMNLPKWLFPVDDIATGRTSPIVRWFYNRVPPDEKIPWSAWIRPLFAWGIFAGAMLATLAAMARLVLEQWARNERLPFPIVQVHSSLIEEPEPGNAFNSLFRSPWLWIGLVGVFCIHMLSVGSTYYPKYFPQVPLKFDLSNIFADDPWNYLRPKLKKAILSFTAVGVTFFIRSRVSFSLWIMFLFCNAVEMQQAMRQNEMSSAPWQDQHHGAVIAFVLGIFWIGRHHWGQVVKGAFGFGDGKGLRAAFWIAIAGIATMFTWLVIVGVQPTVAALIVLFILVAHLTVARVLAETGLPSYRSGLSLPQIFFNFPTRFFSSKDIYFASVFQVMGPVSTRDSLAAYATTGLGVADAVEVEKKRKRYLGGVIGLTLIVGFIAAAVATLYVQYSYPTPASPESIPARNYFGAELVQTRDVASAVDAHATGRFTPKPHNPYLHMAIGFFGTVALEIATLRWANWPLLPVGYVASYGAFIENAWFSILVGWLAQVLIVKFGGAGLFQKAKPFFIGIIFGEGLAAAVWLIANAIIVMNGGDSQSVKFLLP